MRKFYNLSFGVLILYGRFKSSRNRAGTRKHWDMEMDLGSNPKGDGTNERQGWWTKNEGIVSSDPTAKEREICVRENH